MADLHVEDGDFLPAIEDDHLNGDIEEPPTDDDEVLDPSAHASDPAEVEAEHPDQPALLPSFIQNLANLSATPATKPPKAALKAVYAAGKYKAGLTLDVLMVQSFMAGVYIGLAGHLFLAVGGGILGAALFPTGLLAVILTSAELFTGDALIFVASVLGRQVPLRSLLRNWTVSWICNFLGCLAWAYFIAYLSGALVDVGQVDTAIAVSLKKANQPWGHIFLKGIGANLMVCLGVWQATCAEEVAGKVLALWFPITGFVAMGLDHVVANQFLIPIGMMYGADISVVQLLFLDLLPATLGNVVGGGILIGATYWYVFDSMHTSHLFRERVSQGWKITRGGGGGGTTSGTATPTVTSSQHGGAASRLFRRPGRYQQYESEATNHSNTS